VAPSLLSKLKSARKAFLTNFARIYFSQHGEDVVLTRYLILRKATGFYVDVGCWHPKKFSNTYALYRRGWSGINIDFDPAKIACFDLARRRDTNIVAALSDRVETLPVYASGDYDLGATLNSKAASRGMTKRRDVATRTLTDVIDTTKYRDQPIDLLSVDAEQFDLKVLAGLDFDRYRPGIVLTELFAPTIEDVLQADVHRFLTAKGYVLRNWVGPTLVYQRRDAMSQ
jgi:FkbM family methyltransferase